MTLEGLFILFLLALGVWVLVHHINVGISAEAHAKRHTQQQNLILLDQSIIFDRLRLVPSRTSLLKVERSYLFEFSSLGDIRYKGEITMRGNKLHHIELQPHKVNDTPPPPHSLH